MRPDEGRIENAREAVEKVINDYVDVFCVESNDGLTMHVPSLSAWVLLTVHDDAADPAIIATHRMCAKLQASHQSVGLMTLAINDYLRPEDD